MAAWNQVVLGPDPAGFGGQWGYYTDAETGISPLVLLTHRYYDPSVGRFLTRDPIGYSGGVNLYGFAGNNPVTGKDPSGYAPDGGDLNSWGNSTFNGGTWADGLNIFKNNEVVKALGTLGNIVINTPFPDNPFFDVKAAEEAESGASILYHYTSEKRAASILKEEKLNPSLVGGKDARHGPGQYLTDIAPDSMPKGKIARRIWGTPRVGRKMDAVIKINVKGLHIENPAPHIYRVPGETPLDLKGRIMN